MLLPTFWNNLLVRSLLSSLGLSLFQKRFIYYWLIIFVSPSQSRTGIFWGPLWPGPAGSDSQCQGSLCSDCTRSTHCHESSNLPDTSSRNLHTAITMPFQLRPLHHLKGFDVIFRNKNHQEKKHTMFTLWALLQKERKQKLFSKNIHLFFLTIILFYFFNIFFLEEINAAVNSVRRH